MDWRWASWVIVPEEDFVAKVPYWVGAVPSQSTALLTGTAVALGEGALQFSEQEEVSVLDCRESWFETKAGSVWGTSHGNPPLLGGYCWPALLAFRGWDVVETLSWDCDDGRHLWVWGNVGAVQEGNIWAIHLSHAVSVRLIWMLSTYQKYGSPLGRAGSVWPQKGEVCPRPQGLGVQFGGDTKHLPLQCKVMDRRWITLLFINFLFLHKKEITKLKKKKKKEKGS